MFIVNVVPWPFSEYETIIEISFTWSNKFCFYIVIFFINDFLQILLKYSIGLAVRVFANGPGDLGSIPGRVIPKTQKMVLDASLLNTQHYKVRIKGKVEQSREGVAPSPTPWCSSYRKGSLRVTLDYGRQLYLLTAAAIMLWSSDKTGGRTTQTTGDRWTLLY